MEITTVGIDLAKSIFQVHAVDAAGQVVVRKALRRAQVVPFFAKLLPCLVGMEACGTSHHWARELIRLGHDVRLMPPAYVKPYVKRGKTDANDAAAICEAVTRPSMRFVPVKSTEQQAALALHRTRDLLVKQRTQLVNMIRSLLAEFGIEMARGLRHALELAARLSAGDAAEVPPLTQRVVTGLADQIGAVQIQLTRLEKELLAWHRDSDLSQRLATIPGVGIVSATALAASVSEPERFRNGRQFAASLGLTPLQNCTPNLPSRRSAGSQCPSFHRGQPRRRRAGHRGHRVHQALHSGEVRHVAPARAHFDRRKSQPLFDPGKSLLGRGRAIQANHRRP